MHTCPGRLLRLDAWLQLDGLVLVHFAPKGRCCLLQHRSCLVTSWCPSVKLMAESQHFAHDRQRRCRSSKRLPQVTCILHPRQLQFWADPTPSLQLAACLCIWCFAPGGPADSPQTQGKQPSPAINSANEISITGMARSGAPTAPNSVSHKKTQPQLDTVQPADAAVDACMQTQYVQPQPSFGQCQLPSII
jgi:hypothetical protein